MRIASAICTQHELPLRAAWRSAAGDVGCRRICLLALSTDDGRHGYGECAPLPAHGTESPTRSEETLRRWAAMLPGQTVTEAFERLDAADRCPAPAARAALECALLDLIAAAAGKPLARLLAPAARETGIPVNAALGAALALAPSDLAAAVAAGDRVVKLKLGVGEPQAELDAVRALAATLPAGARLRLDANRAWDTATATYFCTALAGLPVESLEEPLAVPTPVALAALQRNLSFALAVDESWREFDQEAFFAAPPVRRLVLKLACQGGLLPALATAQRARAAGVDCVVTTGVDSACGTLAAAHLAAALDNGLAHGLATSSWLAADTGVPPAIAGGSLLLPGTPGLGFVPATRPA